MLAELHKSGEPALEGNLERIQDAAINNRNIFEELMEVSKTCSLG